MLKKVFYFLAFSVSFYSCNDAPVDFETLQNRSGLYFEVNQKDPFSGETISLYESGQVKSQGAILDGLKNGHWVEYYENGQKKSEGTYQLSLKEGKWEYWHENGTVEKVEMTKNGIVLKEEPINNQTENQTGKENSQNGTPNSVENSANSDESSSKPRAITLKELDGGFVNGKIRKTYRGTPYTGSVVDYHND